MKSFNLRKTAIQGCVVILLVCIGATVLLLTASINIINAGGPMLILREKIISLEMRGHKLSKKEMESVVDKAFSKSLRKSYIISVVGSDEDWIVVCFRHPPTFPFCFSSKHDEILILSSGSNQISAIQSDGKVVDFQ
jgi:hypothetical protein